MLQGGKAKKFNQEKMVIHLKNYRVCHLMRRVDSFEETLMFGKIEGRRRSR